MPGDYFVARLILFENYFSNNINALPSNIYTGKIYIYQSFLFLVVLVYRFVKHLMKRRTTLYETDNGTGGETGQLQ